MDLSSTKVCITRCPDYDREHLAASLEELIRSLELKITLNSANVLLKPNLISAKHGPLACTEGSFILAVARLLKDYGARLSIGDSPAFGTSLSVLSQLDLIESLKKMDVKIINFEKARQVKLPSGRNVGMSIEALESDLLVNIPRIKAHAQLRITMAVKNYFGCVVGVRKPALHMIHGGNKGAFPSLLGELLTVLGPGFSLLDGIDAMNKTGPIKGERYRLGVVAASENPVALDSALLTALDVDPQSSPLLLACREIGFAGTDPGELLFPLLSPANLIVKDHSFSVPEQLAPIRFNPFRFFKNNLRRVYQKLAS